MIAGALRNDAKYMKLYAYTNIRESRKQNMLSKYVQVTFCHFVFGPAGTGHTAPM